MRSLDQCFLRGTTTYRGLGVTDRDGPSGQDRDRGTDRDRGSNHDSTDRQDRAQKDRDNAANERGRQAQANEAKDRQDLAIKNERVAQVAQRPFNESVARATLTSALEVARQEATSTVKKAVIPGILVNIIRAPVVAVTAAATGPLAPLTGGVLTKSLPTGDDINRMITEKRIDDAARASLGLDRKNFDNKIERADETDHDRGRDSNANKLVSAVLTHKTQVQTEAFPAESVQSTAPAPAAEPATGLPLLAGGLLALKLIFF